MTRTVRGGWGVRRIAVGPLVAYQVEHPAEGSPVAYGRFVDGRHAMSTARSLNAQDVDLDGLAAMIINQVPDVDPFQGFGRKEA